MELALTDGFFGRLFSKKDDALAHRRSDRAERSAEDQERLARALALRSS